MRKHTKQARADHDEPMRLGDKQKKNGSVCVARGSKVKPENERRKRKPLGEFVSKHHTIGRWLRQDTPKAVPQGALWVSAMCYLHIRAIW